MASTQIMGMTPKKAVAHVLMIGGGAAVTKLAGDVIGDRLWVQTAEDQRLHPRNADEQKKYQLWRGLAVAAGGLMLGKFIWKHNKDIAFAIAAGAMVSGLDRILTVYDVSRQIQNLFRKSDNQLPAPATGTVPTYSAGAIRSNPPRLRSGGETYTGPIVAGARERVPLRQVDEAA